MQDRAGQVAAVVVGAGRAEVAARVLIAARLASPSPVAIVDLRPAHPDTFAIPGATHLSGTPAEAQERIDLLSAVRATVVLVVTHEHEGLPALLEQADRVLGTATA